MQHVSFFFISFIFNLLRQLSRIPQKQTNPLCSPAVPLNRFSLVCVILPEQSVYHPCRVSYSSLSKKPLNSITPTLTHIKMKLNRRTNILLHVGTTALSYGARKQAKTTTDLIWKYRTSGCRPCPRRWSFMTCSFGITILSYYNFLIIVLHLFSPASCLYCSQKAICLSVFGY